MNHFEQAAIDEIDRIVIGDAPPLGVYATAPQPRWYKRLWPVHYVHHIQWAFGYVLLPWLPLSLGLFAGSLRLVRRGDYHDCTATGVY